MNNLRRFDQFSADSLFPIYFFVFFSLRILQNSTSHIIRYYPSNLHDILRISLYQYEYDLKIVNLSMTERSVLLSDENIQIKSRFSSVYHKTSIGLQSWLIVEMLYMPMTSILSPDPTIYLSIYRWEKIPHSFLFLFPLYIL